MASAKVTPSKKIASQKDNDMERNTEEDATSHVVAASSGVDGHQLFTPSTPPRKIDDAKRLSTPRKESGSVSKSEAAMSPTSSCIPVVEVSIKFYAGRSFNDEKINFEFFSYELIRGLLLDSVLAVTEIDSSRHEWKAEFIVCLDWQSDDDDFVPKIVIENALENAEPLEGGGKVRKKKGRKTLTLRYHTTLLTRMDMRDFPFDIQYLDLTIKSQRYHVRGKNYRVPLSNPSKYRLSHVIRKDADLLTEWTLLKLWGGPVSFDSDVLDGYRVQICVEREYMSTLLNFAFPIFCIGMNSMTAYGVYADDLGSRMEVNLTMLLAVVAFKSELSSALPKVPYFTVLE